MISEAQAWHNFEQSVAKMQSWFTRYEELYNATVDQHMKTTWQRTGERLTRAQAEAMVDAMTGPKNFVKVNDAWSQYQRWARETSTWKDVWQAIREHDRGPARTDW